MTTVMYGALLLLGLALLGYTAARVLLGGVVGTGDRRAATGTTASSARQILDQRYAAGEFGTEEYDHRRRVLEGRE